MERFKLLLESVQSSNQLLKLPRIIWNTGGLNLQQLLRLVEGELVLFEQFGALRFPDRHHGFDREFLAPALVDFY